LPSSRRNDGLSLRAAKSRGPRANFPVPLLPDGDRAPAFPASRSGPEYSRFGRSGLSRRFEEKGFLGGSYSESSRLTLNRAYLASPAKKAPVVGTSRRIQGREYKGADTKGT
jgi:hypothetical protein